MRYKVKNLKNELREYYLNFRVDNIENTILAADREAHGKIISEMENFYSQNPKLHPSLLKAKLHELIADNFVPKIFTHSPFFYEMGMRPAERWGIPQPTFSQPASWMHNKFLPEMTNNEESKNFQTFFLEQGKTDSPALWAGRLGFDEDHHCIGYTKLLKTGINGILHELEERRKKSCSEEQINELNAMKQSCQATLKVADRFRKHALKMMDSETDDKILNNLKMIVEAAERVPAKPPRSFYEGLTMLVFLREVTASLESIGISVIGHPDRQLIKLFRADIASGKLTEAAARYLIGCWMLPNDVKTFTREREWPETSTCMMLGGCDENGMVVWNELTRLFIEVHCDLNLINPKLNCRYSTESPREYLHLIADKMLAGYNNFALLNDDTLIPAQIKYGKTETDARLYVNGGCQETMCEGVEHSAGAYYYFNMPELLHLFFVGKDKYEKKLLPHVFNTLPSKLVSAKSFEDFYNQFLHALKKMIAQGAKWSVLNGIRFPEINPCPLFSSTLDDCIKNAMDYKSGGAKYNPSGITLVGLADTVNSLNAVRQIVFEEKSATLNNLQIAVANNWYGAEALCQKILNLPRFGHGNSAVDELGTRLAADIAAFVHTISNERGEFFQPSFFVYWSFKTFGDHTGATPDGRHDGEILSQGIAPHREHAPQSLTNVIRSVSSIDFKDYPGNAVLDILLPAGNKINSNTLISLIKTVAAAGIPTLQLNCVSPTILREAQKNPEKHSNLIVRISGLSAVFIKLTKEVQDEIISRPVYIS